MYDSLQINGYVIYHLIKMEDLGGAIGVHYFGAIFGIAISRVLFKPSDKIYQNPLIERIE